MDKKLICFDLDGTLTAQSTWEAFNTALGISVEDDQRLFLQYKEGSLEYGDWITELMRLYKEHPPVTRTDIEQIATTIAPRPESQKAIEDAKAKGYHIIAIAGAVDVMAQSLATRLGIEELFTANKAVFNENDELITIEDSGHERDAKLSLLKQYCDTNGYTLSEVICVGDGGNDLEIFKNAKGVLLGDNKDLAPIAWKQIHSLSELNDLLGI
ncbi:MAG TPA: HAD-IB family phosphatase [Candidatus Paceibacterota bacterium]|nr:HAD-IB family phosphatase [Candidatus Paceibacterota bacterium]